MENPFSIALPLPEGFEAAPDILALGGELKSSICRVSRGKAAITEAIGDLEQESIYRHFSDQVDAVFKKKTPAHLVIDRHPDYLSAQWGQKLAREHGVKITAVQHHHAHIASVMADNGLPINSKPVLGIALDGLGFGDDGSIWGGELLLADYHGFQRLACFKPAAMLGGAAAIHEPWRNTMAHLLPIREQVFDRFTDIEIIQFLKSKPVQMLQTMIDRGLNAPQASSCGRLFDAVAATLGLCREKVGFEAEAAIALEQLASTCFEHETKTYAYSIDEGLCLQLNWQPMWLELLRDLQRGTEAAIIASRFHHTLIHALSAVTLKLKEAHHFDSIALSGGVFQNRLLSTGLAATLQKKGLPALQHRQLPTHDGGLSLGQAVIAAAHVSFCHSS